MVVMMLTWFPTKFADHYLELKNTTELLSWLLAGFHVRKHLVEHGRSLYLLLDDVCVMVLSWDLQGIPQSICWQMTHSHLRS